MKQQNPSKIRRLRFCEEEVVPTSLMDETLSKWTQRQNTDAGRAKLAPIRIFVAKEGVQKCASVQRRSRFIPMSHQTGTTIRRLSAQIIAFTPLRMFERNSQRDIETVAMVPARQCHGRGTSARKAQRKETTGNSRNMALLEGSMKKGIQEEGGFSAEI